jgi:hypothetical protein
MHNNCLFNHNGVNELAIAQQFSDELSVVQQYSDMKWRTRVFQRDAL